ncbi:MAG: class B sortase [Oscillospiraceae bacterium]|nr:class B sortase [Oscillospiraceae bacterium]
MATASYNTRPRPQGIYVSGRKRSPLTRFLMRVFPCKGDSAFEAVRKVIFIGALFSLIYFGGKELFVVGNDLYQQHKIELKLKDIFEGSIDVPDDVREEVLRVKPDILPDYIQHYHFNNDLVGHIMIPDISSPLPYNDLNRYILNYLVYQSDNNKYYLTHNFDGSTSAGGSVFADYRNLFGDDGSLSPNTVLYGHNIHTGNYFNKVASYYKAFEKRDLSFYRQHPIVHFNTIYERHDWKIFAVVLFNTQPEYGDVYPYHTFREFSDKADFNDYILNIMDRSVLFTDVDIDYGDHILTLSTCYWPYGQNVDTRSVVFARMVREGESSNVDVMKATHNENFLPFERQKRIFGDTWTGRVWDYERYLLSWDGE